VNGAWLGVGFYAWEIMGLGWVGWMRRGNPYEAANSWSNPGQTRPMRRQRTILRTASWNAAQSSAGASPTSTRTELENCSTLS